MKMKIKTVLAIIIIAISSIHQVNAGAILWSVMENMVFENEADMSEGKYLDEYGINAARVKMIDSTTGTSRFLSLYLAGGAPYPTGSVLTWTFDPDLMENYAGPIWTEDIDNLENKLFQIEAGSWDGNSFTPIAASKIRTPDDEVFINYGMTWRHDTGTIRSAYNPDPLAYPQMGHWNEDFYLDKVPPIPEPSTTTLFLMGILPFFIKRRN